jgi:hypothetical protein
MKHTMEEMNAALAWCATQPAAAGPEGIWAWVLSDGVILGIGLTPQGAQDSAVEGTLNAWMAGISDEESAVCMLTPIVSEGQPLRLDQDGQSPELLMRMLVAHGLVPRADVTRVARMVDVLSRRRAA